MYTTKEFCAGGECIRLTLMLVSTIGRILPTMEIVCVVLGVVANQPYTLAASDKAL